MVKRKLASIVKISDISPIKGADFIEVATWKGWQTVVKKGEFSVGDLVVGIETDSWVPNTLAPFLSNGKEPKIYNDVPGERLRTIKFKKQVSQGLLLPLSIMKTGILEEGTDLTLRLGIQKWERPIPAQLAGQMKGNFPHFLRKTDQERVQNIPEDKLAHLLQTNTWQVTEKLDGSSMTIYFKDFFWGVTSRNVDLKLDQEGNTFVDMFNSLKPQLSELAEMLCSLGVYEFAVQGELIGGNIQGNQYKIEGYEFRVFSIFNIRTQKYLKPEDVKLLSDTAKLLHAPVLDSSLTLDPTVTIPQLLAMAEGKSELNNSDREGIVLKNQDGTESFKIIANNWLLKGND